MHNIIYFLYFRVRNRFPEQLMQTRLPIITRQECLERLDAHVPEEEICTLDTSRRRSTCKGDQGGPLVYENRLLGMLIYSGWLNWSYPDVFVNFNNHNIRNMINFHMNQVRGVH